MGRHRITDADVEKRRGHCSECGVVRIVKCRKFWRCGILKKRELDAYYSANREKIIQQKRLRYQQRTPIPTTSEQKRISRDYHRNKRQTDVEFRLAANYVEFRLAANLRTRLCLAIKRNTKAGSAVRDLGCSISHLRTYLENKFRPGMTWQNWGDWHIDHIRPLSSFNLTDREQFLEACHYSNLQRLWKLENFRKSGQYP